MMKRKIVLITLGLLLGFGLLAQSAPKDTSRQKEVQVDHADVFEYIQKKDTVLQKLNGNVELRQDSIYMYCDTALIQNETRVFARGDVIIQQGDSLSVFSDSATYDGGLRIAELFGDVILVNGQQQLFTDRLTYDLNTKVATYDNSATLIMNETQLTSKKGYYYVQEKEIFFKDSVVVIDPQFSLRSDTLGFNTETEIVSFLGPTLISNDSTKVYCEDGFYDTRNNLAVFSKNAQYVKGSQVAIADSISYDGSKQMYSLEGNASFEENDRKASADIIRYDEANDKTILIGNAKYKDKEQDIIANEIIYDARNERYATRGRSRISDPPQILEADQVDFNEVKGIGLAFGNVIWRDTSADITILCEMADYDRKTDYLKASGGQKGRPMLITLLDEDSLFMVADTLVALRAETTTTADTLIAANGPTRIDSTAMDSTGLDTLSAQLIEEIPLEMSPDTASTEALTDRVIVISSDSLSADTLLSNLASDSLVMDTTLSASAGEKETPRLLRAYHDVRIYSMDMQAICDSLQYSTVDSLFRLFREPIVWSDTSQFYADTVRIQLANNQINKIFLRKNSFIINSPDELFFNQIKGKDITAFFIENELRRTAVNGNAESVYYAIDDAGGYVGVNKTICSEMMLFFGNNEVEQIKFFNEPKANMLPMGQANHRELQMPGFNWEKDYRPQSIDDLFKEQPSRFPILAPVSTVVDSTELELQNYDSTAPEEPADEVPVPEEEKGVKAESPQAVEGEEKERNSPNGDKKKE
jgi:lipopolysaccharide transport protein LptA